MRCEQCGQVSDWVGDGDWLLVSDTGGSVRPLLECAKCGNTQRAR